MTKSTRSSQHPLAFEKHDHKHCTKMLAQEAEAVCRAKGLRLTELRREALDILSQSHRALGAYDVVEEFKARGRRATPPMAYRALSFLVEHGFAHRIESMNAFVACCGPDEQHHPAFLICTDCKAVAEIDSQKARKSIQPALSDSGFQVKRSVLELLGNCPDCAASQQ